MRMILIMLLLSTLGAVAAQAPTVTDDQRLRLQMFELQIENIALKVQSLQQQLQKVQGDARLYIEAQAKDGYVLDRTEQGWVYVAKPGSGPER